MHEKYNSPWVVANEASQVICVVHVPVLFYTSRYYIYQLLPLVTYILINIRVFLVIRVPFTTHEFTPYRLESHFHDLTYTRGHLYIQCLLALYVFANDSIQTWASSRCTDNVCWFNLYILSILWFSRDDACTTEYQFLFRFLHSDTLGTYDKNVYYIPPISHSAINFVRTFCSSFLHIFYLFSSPIFLFWRPIRPLLCIFNISHLITFSALPYWIMCTNYYLLHVNTFARSTLFYEFNMIWWVAHMNVAMLPCQTPQIQI